MTAINKVTTTGTDSRLPIVKPSPSLKNLAAKVVEVRRTWRELYKERAALQPKDEKKFLKRVMALSVLENEVIEGYKTLLTDATIVEEFQKHANLSEAEAAKTLGFDPENFGPLAETATKVTKQLKTLRAPLKKPVVTPPAKAPVKTPVTAPVKIKAPAKPASAPKPVLITAADTQRMNTARTAMQALEDHLNTPGADEPTKIRLTTEMDRTLQEVRAGNSSQNFLLGREFKTLLQQHDRLLAAAWAPKIPANIMADFEKDLPKLSERIAKLPTKCKSLEEYIAVQKEEEQIQTCITNLKGSYRRWLWHEGINVSPNLTVKSDSLGLDIPTDLSMRLEEITMPFAKNQLKRAENQDAFIAKNYTEEDMGGGGDCLFRALLGCLGYNPNMKCKNGKRRHENDRKNIATYMLQNRERYAESIHNRIKEDHLEAEINAMPGEDQIERYINWINKTGNWGGMPEIQAASDFLGRPIIAVLRANGDTRATTFNPVATNAKDSSTLAIMNRGYVANDGKRGSGTHFVSLRPKAK